MPMVYTYQLILGELASVALVKLLTIREDFQYRYFATRSGMKRYWFVVVEKAQNLRYRRRRDWLH